jgi:hypothetical protein
VTERLSGWQKNGWRKAGKKPAKNEALAAGSRSAAESDFTGSPRAGLSQCSENYNSLPRR